MTITATPATFDRFNGNGTAGPFTYTFTPYEADDVFVYIWNASTQVYDKKTITTHYTIDTTTKRITFTSGNHPVTGTGNIVITRATDAVQKHTFQVGSSLKAEDLNNSFNQTFYKLQELENTTLDNGLKDTSPKLYGNLDANSNKVLNVATPTASTDAVNKSYVDAATVALQATGDTAPSNPAAGDRWFDTASGRTFVYYTDTDSSAWVEAAPPIDSGSNSNSYNLPAASATSLGGIKVGNNLSISNGVLNASAGGSGSISDGDKGDITVSNSGGTWTIDDDAVTTDKILDNAIDGTKIALGSDAAGDLTYYDGTNYVRLPKGSAGQVLKVNSGETAPEWSTVSGSGTVTSVASGTGLTGGPITASGTLNVDVGTSANKVVQLDGNAKLPAVDGSQLTNITASGSIAASTVDAKGDLLAATADNTIARVAVGTNGYVLSANSSTAAGVEWIQQSAGSNTYNPGWTNSISTRSLTDRLKDSVSVKDFGATGDGSTDDTTSISNALTYAIDNKVEVHFPAGTYKQTGQISLALNDQDKLYIKADGLVEWAMQCGNTAAINITFAGNHWQSNVANNAIVVDGFTFTTTSVPGTHANSRAFLVTGSNLEGRHPTTNRFINCFFRGATLATEYWAYAVELVDSSCWVFDHCEFWADMNASGDGTDYEPSGSNGGWGKDGNSIYIRATANTKDPTNLKVTSCSFLYGDVAITTGNYFEGLYIANSEGVNNKTFVKCASNESESGLHVVNCHASTSRTTFNLDRMHHLSITGCLLFPPIYTGSSGGVDCIRLSRSGGYSIVGNVIHNVRGGTSFDTSAIKIENSATAAADGAPDGGIVAGNSFHDFAGTGNNSAVWIANTGQNAYIADNHYSYCGANVLNQGSNNTVYSSAGVTTYTQGSTGSDTRTVTARLQDYVSVKDFGAVGDGSTDDLNAFNEAIAANVGAIYVPKGTYKISGTLTCADKNLKLVGAGEKSSILKFTGNSGNGLSWTDAGVDNGLTIRDLAFEAGGARSGSPISVVYSTTLGGITNNVLIENVSINGADSSNYWANGIYLDHARHSTLNRVSMACYASGTTYGIKFHGTQTSPENPGTGDSRILNCHFASINGPAIEIEGKTEGTHIHNCIGIAVKTGVDSTRSAGEPLVIITDCHFNTTEYGIRFGKTMQSTIKGCLLYGVDATNWTGIYIDTSGDNNDIIVANNIIHGRTDGTGTQVGIELNNGIRFNISNNIYKHLDIGTKIASTAQEVQVLDNMFESVGSRISDGGSQTLSTSFVESSGGNIYEIYNGNTSENTTLKLSSGSDYGQLHCYSDGNTALEAGGTGTLKLYTNGASRAEINSNGRFVVWKADQIGTYANFLVSPTNNGNFNYRGTNNAGHGIVHYESDVGGTKQIVAYIRADGEYHDSSDYRLKDNIQDVTDGITKVKGLKPKTYKWKSEGSGKTQWGFLAHEVQSIIPDIVEGSKDQINTDGSIKPQSLGKMGLIPVLTKALQEAITKIETLETKVAALEAK